MFSSHWNSKQSCPTRCKVSQRCRCGQMV